MSQNQALFIEGSIIKHLLKNTLGISLGIATLFLADVINIIFISYATSTDSMAALGYGLTIILFMKAVALGFAVAIPAIIGQRIGAKNWTSVSNGVYSLLITAIVISLFIVAVTLPMLHFILKDLGASGTILTQAYNYGFILISGLPITIFAMGTARLIQVYGDIKNYMFVAILGGILTIGFDFLFIIILHYGVIGAAISLLLSRLAGTMWALWIIFKKHTLPFLLTKSIYYQEFKNSLKYIFPSILSQINMPVVMMVFIYFIGKYGTDYMANWAVISRLWPFMLIFPLSIIQGGASIASQNLGAKAFDRVKKLLYYMVSLLLLNSIVMGIIINLLFHYIILLFHVPTKGLDIFNFYVHIQVPMSFINMYILLTVFMLIVMGRAMIGVVINWLVVLSVIPLTIFLTPYMHAISVQLSFTIILSIFTLVCAFILPYIFIKTKKQYLKTVSPLGMDPLQEVIEASGEDSERY